MSVFVSAEYIAEYAVRGGGSVSAAAARMRRQERRLRRIERVGRSVIMGRRFGCGGSIGG